MQSRLITYPDSSRWNDFVSSSLECPVLQSFEWGELKAHFGWEPLRIAIEDNDKIIAAISILKKKIPYLNYPIFYAPRGPVVDFSNKELVDYLLNAVEKEAEKSRAVSLKIDPDISERPVASLARISALGFLKASRQIQPRATILLDLDRELDDIIKGFEEKTRYNIRLSDRKGVIVREEPTLKGIEAFYKLYQETAARDKFSIHPLKYYQKIREIMFTAGLGSNFVAYFAGEPVAAVIVFCFGRKIWYMYGASSANYRNVMPNHLLHWEIIKWAKARNLKVYDLWGIPVEPKVGHPLYGVYRFKKGFNGRTVVNIGAYDFPYSPLFYNIFEHGVVWFKNIRSLLTKGKIVDSLGE
ncbi:MAG: peptidoglycan bridge formation glycyltransferase FemA/FemB family protein [bacterium]